MEEDELIERFFEATLDQDDVDYEPFLDSGGSEISAAVHLHQLFQKAAESWNQEERPRQLGRFEIVGDLGAGGIGRVYLGWDPELLRHVAIKVIARDRWAINEARSIAKLDHHSIVRVFEVGHDHLVMELLDGGTLQDKIEDLEAGNENPLQSERARLHCLVRIAEGLAYCHARGILHRDIKPSNVLFPKGGEHPRLIDFGLAHLDELESLDITQNLVGSPAYLAPEQVQSGETGTDHRSDIFSFGILAYELLTLVSPFRKETRQDTLNAVLAAHPESARKVNGSISRPVGIVLEHCMEQDPGRRYQSMQAVVEDLQNAMANRPLSVGRRSVFRRGALFLRRHRKAASFAALGIGVAATASLALWFNGLVHERATFALRLERYQEETSGIHSAQELFKLGTALSHAKYDARTLDGSLVGSWIEDASELAAQAIEQWSRHLGSELEELADFDKGVFPPSTWRGLLTLDEDLIPSASWNEVARSRGRVTLSPELLAHPDLVAFRQIGATGQKALNTPQVFRSIQLPEYPEEGYYRLEIPGVWQREFYIESAWGAPLEIAWIKPTLDSSAWIHWTERGFRVSPLITLGPYTEVTDISASAIRTADNYPATAHTQAQEYAAKTGGRLPMCEELFTLFEGDWGLTPHSQLEGEHVADIISLWPIEFGATFSYAAFDGKRFQSRLDCLGSFPRDAVDTSPHDDHPNRPGGYAFRIVYVDPSAAPGSLGTTKVSK